jgi:hypothetical protein
MLIVPVLLFKTAYPCDPLPAVQFPVISIIPVEAFVTPAGSAEAPVPPIQAFALLTPVISIMPVELFNAP